MLLAELTQGHSMRDCRIIIIKVSQDNINTSVKPGWMGAGTNLTQPKQASCHGKFDPHVNNEYQKNPFYKGSQTVESHPWYNKLG